MSGSTGGSSGGGGPCGACKFLRRKCVKGCIFAPYFDSEQGTSHFAAVHKVFGASNASKLLNRIPSHKRLDAVVTLCYEALARLRDPVYGCVGHIFTLQQQVVNLQAELAYIQARLALLHRLPIPPPSTEEHHHHHHHNNHNQSPSSLHSDITSSTTITDHLVTSSISNNNTQTPSMGYDSLHAYSDLSNPSDQDPMDEGDLQALAREFVCKYLPGVRFRNQNDD